MSAYRPISPRLTQFFGFLANFSDTRASNVQSSFVKQYYVHFMYDRYVQK